MILAWLVLERTDSPFMVALVGFFAWLPMLLLGLVGGLLVDSMNRAWLIRATHGATAAAAVIITVLLATDAIEVWHAYGVILVTGLGNTIDQPARRALVHDFLGSSGVTNGLALEAVAFSSSKVIGPAAGGVIIAAAGLTEAYMVVCLLFASAASLVWLMRVTHEARRSWSARSVSADLASAVRYTLSHPVMKAVVAITVLMNVFLFPFTQMVPVIGRDVLGVDSGLVGVLMAADGMGALVGAVTIASMANVRRHGLVFAFGAMAGTLSLVALSFSREYGLSIASMLALGVGMACFGTMQGAITVLVSDHAMRGRALGVVGLAIGTSPLGSLLVGTMANSLGATSAIRINGLVGFLLLAVVTSLSPSIRRPLTAPDASDR